MRGILWTLMISLWLQACALPAQRLHEEALENGFQPVALSGGGFQLSAYFKPAARPSQILHVYLEGDGQPWATRTLVAEDPTPRNPLMLRLMALDDGPALYLSRPCYNGHARDAGCSPLLWTHRRYAPEIVNAMAGALRAFLRTHHYDALEFLGHSGGGALALMLADQFPQARSVVTLAGNLDIVAWTEFHGYSRLQGSLNPVDLPPAHFDEWHYLGEEDEMVPPRIVLAQLKKRPHAHVVVLRDTNHSCCWEPVWPTVLARLRESGAAL